MAEIAVGLAIEVIKKTSSIVADLAVKEGSRFSRLQEEISWVEKEMRHIHSYLKDVEHKQGENERVANLMNVIRDLAFDVEDTMEKYFPVRRPKRKGFKGFLESIFSDPYSTHNFLVEIEAIKRRVEDVPRVRQTYGITECNEQVAENERDWLEAMRRLNPHVDEPNLTGFGDHIENLIAQVHDEDPSLRVISIIGMAGLGKTTVAKKVFNSLRHSFNLTACVTVSEKPIVKNILKDIARQVGSQIDRWEDNGEAILYQHLRQHRYLIVIDDIWDTRTWDIMKNAIPTTCSNNCSRIILTSRNRDVGVHVGGRGSLFELQPLEERYSKQLFEISMGPQQTENDTDELKKIGERILHRCKGVPLAIVVAAGLLKLKERSVSAWKGVLEQMDQAQDECSEIFALSYTDLPAYLKPCFLYLGIFPEDHQIDAFDLINLWIAEGFVEGSRNREAEDVGEGYLNLLIARNLLVQVVRKRSNGKVESCCIHDILRALCIQKAKEINFFYSSADLTDHNGQRVRRVTTHGAGLQDFISSNHRTPKLRSFLCFGEDANEELLKDFTESLDYLRVAYFHVNRNCGGPVLSTNWSSRNFTYLKLQNHVYVRPDMIQIGVLNSIIFMENLVTLDLQFFASRFDFPMAIWNMKRLRHLLLPNRNGTCAVNQGFDPSAVSFKNFQTLSRVWYTELGDPAWLHQFSNLRTLRIVGCNQTAADLLLLTSSVALNKLETLKFRSDFGDRRMSVSTMNLSSYEKLSELCLIGIDIGQWPEPDPLPPNLTKLQLSYTGLNGDPLQIMKKIPKLRVLLLYFPSFDGNKMVCSGEPGSFSQLEELEIWSFDTDVEIVIEEGGMPKLNKALILVSLEPVVPDRIRRFMDFKRVPNCVKSIASGSVEPDLEF